MYKKLLPACAGSPWLKLSVGCCISQWGDIPLAQNWSTDTFDMAHSRHWTVPSARTDREWDGQSCTQLPLWRNVWGRSNDRAVQIHCLKDTHFWTHRHCFCGIHRPKRICKSFRRSPRCWGFFLKDCVGQKLLQCAQTSVHDVLCPSSQRGPRETWILHIYHDQSKCKWVSQNNQGLATTSKSGCASRSAVLRCSSQKVNFHLSSAILHAAFPHPYSFFTLEGKPKPFSDWGENTCKREAEQEKVMNYNRWEASGRLSWGSGRAILRISAAVLLHLLSTDFSLVLGKKNSVIGHRNHPTTSLSKLARHPKIMNLLFVQ